ncbi:DUF6339 family protein [Pseudomonas sp. KU26590]|uniref:DUF6339 family protein n=1 Tax=Pseudomonas sp. KU26590 TaxID=2991051 RepID=UPI00223CFCD4|nr:DUF6339 family protein [Pseudomonas sp. KU26590]UZJ61728.1 DUF6339 family protein [Pseudomonas sp. KU26590]
MAIALLPRLKPIGVDTALGRFHETGVNTRSTLNILSDYSDVLSFAPSGGYKTGKAAVDIGHGLKQVAQSAGFPRIGSQSAKAKFDQEAAIYLAQAPELFSGEALRNDVWAFIATVIIPDLVMWRFPGENRSRFAGGNRNTFQRLWMRGKGLDRGCDHADRWGLVKALPEDAMVQIFERPSIASSQRLATAVAECWVSASIAAEKGTMEDIMRRAMKILRIRSEIIDFAYLDTEQLEKAITTIFKDAMSVRSAS